MPPVAGDYQLFGNDTRNFGEAELAERLCCWVCLSERPFVQPADDCGKCCVAVAVIKKIFRPRPRRGEVQALLDSMELTPLADVTPANVAANWRQQCGARPGIDLEAGSVVAGQPAGGPWRAAPAVVASLSRPIGAKATRVSGGKPVTLVVTADDLRPWQGPRRKYALLHDKKFILLGAWK